MPAIHAGGTLKLEERGPRAEEFRALCARLASRLRALACGVAHASSRTYISLLGRSRMILAEGTGTKLPYASWNSGGMRPRMLLCQHSRFEGEQIYSLVNAHAMCPPEGLLSPGFKLR